MTARLSPVRCAAHGRCPAIDAPRGFTLVELCIVVVVVGILAAIAIPNFIEVQDRAKEASTKTNMHAMQLRAEDFAVGTGGWYPRTAAECMGGVPMTDNGMQLVDPPTPADAFANPFSHESGEGASWENRDAFAGPASTTPGIVSYSFFAGDYNIKAQGAHAGLSLVLVNGGTQ